MSKHSPNMGPDRLLQLSEEVSRIAGSLAKLSMEQEHRRPIDSSLREADAPEVSEDMVRWVINARKLRSRFLPTELFADPAWDILLELLRAEIAQQRIAVSSLCIAANAPATTALRYIKAMAQQAMIVRQPDPFDGRRVYVVLAPAISNALRRYFVDVFQRPVATKARMVA